MKRKLFAIILAIAASFCIFNIQSSINEWHSLRNDVTEVIPGKIYTSKQLDEIDRRAATKRQTKIDEFNQASFLQQQLWQMLTKYSIIVILLALASKATRLSASTFILFAGTFLTTDLVLSFNYGLW
jgi:hypothetical protein